MPTTAQLLEMEKRGLITPQQQDTIGQLRERGAFPPAITAQTGEQQVADTQRSKTGLPSAIPRAPVSTAAPAPTTPPQAAAPSPAPTPEEPSLAQRAAGAAKTVAGETLFQGLVRPGAELNRFGYSIIGKAGGIFDDPKAYKAQRVRAGLYGASRLSEDMPHGFLEHLGAATAPLEGALLTTPGGRVVFGLGVAARSAADDQVGDAVEGVGGLVLLGRDLYRAGKLIRRAVGPFTAAEKAYKAAKEAVPAAEKTAQEAQAAAQALQVRVQEAQAQAHAVASAAEDVAKGNVAQAEGEHRAALEHVGHLEAATPQPADTLRTKMGLTGGGPGAAQAGEMLRAVGEDITQLAPPGAEEVGVTAMAQRIAKQRRGLYTKFEAKADELGVHLPAGSPTEGTSAGATVIRRRAVQYMKDLIAGQGSVSERSIGKELAMLGVKGVRDPDTGEVFTAATPAKLRELVSLNPRMEIVHEDVPLSRLSKLYARARTIGLSPREFPTTGNQAKRSYSRLTSVLQGTMRALAQSDPELAQLHSEAQTFVRRVEKPFLSETAARVLTKSKTPRAAFDLLMADDPTTVTRLFTHASGPEREALTHAMFSELVDAAKNEDGKIDRLALAKSFSALPQETRELMAGFGNGAAKMVIDEAVVHRKALESARTGAETAKEGAVVARRALRDVRERKRDLLTGMKQVQREYLRRSADDVKAALHAAHHAAKQVEDLGEVPRRESKTVLHFTKSMRMFGKMHAVMAIADLVHGNVVRALLQAGEAAIFLKRPRLVKEALETPIDTPRGREIAAALHVILQRHLGPPQKDDEQQAKRRVP